MQNIKISLLKNEQLYTSIKQVNQKLYLITLLEPIPILGNYALLFYISTIIRRMIFYHVNVLLLQT